MHDKSMLSDFFLQFINAVDNNSGGECSYGSIKSPLYIRKADQRAGVDSTEPDFLEKSSSFILLVSLTKLHNLAVVYS